MFSRSYSDIWTHNVSLRWYLFLFRIFFTLCNVSIPLTPVILYLQVKRCQQDYMFDWIWRQEKRKLGFYKKPRTHSYPLFLVRLRFNYTRENEGIQGWACPSVCLSVCPSVCLSRLMWGTLCTRVGYEGVELELWNFIHVYTKVWSRASSRFHLDRLKIVDSGAL